MQKRKGERLEVVETFGHILEVFGEPDMGWYGWRLYKADSGQVVADDQEACYSAKHVAMREGLNAAELLE